MFAACRDAITGLEYLHRAGRMVENGLHLELGAYKHSVLLDWRDLREDAAHPWGQLCEMLGGRGAASLDDALRDLRLKPAHDALRCAACPGIRRAPRSRRQSPFRQTPVRLGIPAERQQTPATTDVARLESEHLRNLLEQVQALLAVEEYAGLRRVPVPDWREHLERVLNSFEQQLEAAVRIPGLERQFAHGWPAAAREVLPALETPAEKAVAAWGTVLAWSVMHAVGAFLRPNDPNRGAARAFEALRLREPMAEAFQELGLLDEARWQAAARVRASFAHAFADGARPPAAEAVPRKSNRPCRQPEVRSVGCTIPMLRG